MGNLLTQPFINCTCTHIIIIQTPVERVLGRGHKVRSSGGTREVKECCYDIPLLESLQALLKNVSVCDQVIRKD